MVERVAMREFANSELNHLLQLNSQSYNMCMSDYFFITLYEIWLKLLIKFLSEILMWKVR